MSGRADIIALAQTLGLPSTDALLLDRYYTEALIAFGQETEINIEPRFIPVVAGVSEYEVPDTNAIKAVFYGTRELTRVTLQHLTTYDVLFRTRSGTPREFTERHENHNVILLYPVPDATSTPAVLAPLPFGDDYPPDYLVIFASDRDETAAPWLDYTLALTILSRELVRQSNHRDDAIAAMATKLASMTRSAGGAP